jgi:polysaccharide biosynthesis/export protein
MKSNVLMNNLKLSTLSRSWWWLAFTAVGVVCLVSGGCSGRSFFQPRSEIIKEAEEEGVPVLSVEEDRARFFAKDQLQKKRLLALIRQRSQGETRDKNYRFGGGDEIEINVFDVPELNVTSKIRPSGYINLPLVGAIKAAGLTEPEFHDDLQKRLTTFVRNPQVSVFVAHYGSQKVAVMGAVRKPGNYALKKGSNGIVELLGQAGGVSEKAGNFITILPAEISGLGSDNDVEARAQLALASQENPAMRATGIEVYLDQVLGTSGGIPIEIPVHGGDTVIVPEAGKVMVEGEVEKPGSYDLSQQMTLLGALASSGGITYSAKTDEVEVIREIDMNEKAHLVLDLQKIGSGEEKDVRLRNGDIVRVPSHSGRRLSQDTYNGITKIINIGVGGSVSLVP